MHEAETLVVDYDLPLRLAGMGDPCRHRGQEADKQEPKRPHGPRSHIQVSRHQSSLNHWRRDTAPSAAHRSNAALGRQRKMLGKKHPIQCNDLDEALQNAEQLS